MVLEVPYMALTFIACSDAAGNRARALTAQIVLAGALILNLSTRLFEPLLYCGAEYFGSLTMLGAVLALTGTSRVPSAKVPAEPDLAAGST
jgi:hypothetical protein